MKTLKISDEEIKLIMECLFKAKQNAREQHDHMLTSHACICMSTFRSDSEMQAMRKKHLDMERKTEELYNKLSASKLEI